MGNGEWYRDALRDQAPLRRMAKLAPCDRPREKMLRRGPAALTEVELLAAVLGNGTRKRGVGKLAWDVRTLFEEPESNSSVEALRKRYSLGESQACRLAAVRELILRKAATKAIRIRRIEDCLPLVAFIAPRRQEHLVCVSLSGGGDVIGTRVVTVGLIDSVPVHPREVFAEALAERASAVILAHNHPSGSAKPSREDIRLTRRLREAGTLLGVELLDHLILAGDRFTSMRRKGHLT